MSRSCLLLGCAFALPGCPRGLRTRTCPLCALHSIGSYLVELARYQKKVKDNIAGLTLPAWHDSEPSAGLPVSLVSLCGGPRVLDASQVLRFTPDTRHRLPASYMSFQWAEGPACSRAPDMHDPTSACLIRRSGLHSLMRLLPPDCDQGFTRFRALFFLGSFVCLRV